MGRIEVYTCDHCGHEQENNRSPRQMWWITLFVRTEYMPSLYYEPEVRRLWCQDCLAKWSMTRPAEKQDHPEKVLEPTFEDKLRELIQEEISLAQD